MIEEYWEIIKKNLNKLEQQLFCWCNNKGIIFLMDDFHQAILQVAESILKGYWKKEMNYNNVNNYLFITFRNINYLKLKDKLENDSDDIINTIPFEDEEYEEDNYIEIEKVFKYIADVYGRDKVDAFKDKLMHKSSTLNQNAYISILKGVRQHFYPKVGKWFGDYEKCQENKKKLKEWRLNNPNATKEEYYEFYRELNNAKIKSYLKEWRDNNREKTKEFNNKYKEYRKEYSKKKWIERKKLNNGIYEEKYIP